MVGLRTKLGDILKPYNSESGKALEGWATAPAMLFVMFLFAIFLLIILQVYNSSLVLDNVDVDWSAAVPVETTLTTN